MRGELLTVEICVLCGRYLLAAIQLALSDSELHCCALKRTGTFAMESKVNLLTDFKK